MKEVARYKNEMNTLSIGKWTAEEMNFLFAILTQVRDEGCKNLNLTLMICVSMQNLIEHSQNVGIKQ